MFFCERFILTVYLYNVSNTSTVHCPPVPLEKSSCQLKVNEIKWELSKFVLSTLLVAFRFSRLLLLHGFYPIVNKIPNCCTLIRVTTVFQLVLSVLGHHRRVGHQILEYCNSALMELTQEVCIYKDAVKLVPYLFTNLRGNCYFQYLSIKLFQKDVVVISNGWIQQDLSILECVFLYNEAAMLCLWCYRNSHNKNITSQTDNFGFTLCSLRKCIVNKSVCGIRMTLKNKWQ